MEMTRDITFSHNGKYFVIISEYCKIHVFDANTKTKLDYFCVDDMIGTCIVKFSIDDKHLIICDLCGNLFIYETSTFALTQRIIKYGDELAKSYVEFSPDGKFFIHGRIDTNVQIYDANTFQLLHKLSTKKTCLRGISFSGDSRQMAIGGEYGGTKIYDMKSFALLHTIHENFGMIYNVCFSGNGKYLAQVGFRAVKIFDAQTFQEIAVLGGLNSVKALFSRNGKHMAILSSENLVYIYDVKTFQNIYTSKKTYALAKCFQFSMDGQWLFIGDFSNYIHLLNLTTFKMEKLRYT